MKVSFLMWLTCGICAADTLTSNVRVSLQFIGMAHPVMTELLKDPEAGGAALHAKAMALAKQGKAEIVETCVLTCRSGEGASAGSLREEIFPTEFGTLEFPDHSMTPAPPPVAPLPAAPPEVPLSVLSSSVASSMPNRAGKPR